jgi:thymidylate kinase
MPPNEMFVLRVEPETAVSRKTDEPATHVFTRSTELWNFNWQQADVHLIDASRSVEEVQADLRSKIWNMI